MSARDETPQIAEHLQVLRSVCDELLRMADNAGKDTPNGDESTQLARTAAGQPAAACEPRTIADALGRAPLCGRESATGRPCPDHAPPARPAGLDTLLDYVAGQLDDEGGDAR